MATHSNLDNEKVILEYLPNVPMKSIWIVCTPEYHTYIRSTGEPTDNRDNEMMPKLDFKLLQTWGCPHTPLWTIKQPYVAKT